MSETTFSPRQETLLAAAVRVVASSGLRGLTHRAVDAEAGLPQGTCSAYLRTRLALLTRLTEYVAAQFAHEIAALVARIEEHPAKPGYAVRETAGLLRGWLATPELLLVRMELAIEGSRQPAVAEIFARQSQQLVDVVEHAIDSVGHERAAAPGPSPGWRELPDHRLRAVTLIASIDGVLLRALSRHPDERDAGLRASLALLMDALLDETSAPDPGSPV